MNKESTNDINHSHTFLLARYSSNQLPSMVLLITGVVIIFLVAYVMLMPVTIVVDTDNDFYKVTQPGVFSIQVVRINDLSIEIRIAGVRIQTTPKQSRSRQDIENSKMKAQSKPKFHSVSAWRFLIQKTIRSFRVHHFDLNIDTGNFVLNAHLFPVLYFASRGKYSMKINFVGQNYFGFRGNIRPISLIWAYILFQTKQ